MLGKWNTCIDRCIEKRVECENFGFYPRGLMDDEKGGGEGGGGEDLSNIVKLQTTGEDFLSSANRLVKKCFYCVHCHRTIVWRF